jgi:hypothetical protein
MPVFGLIMIGGTAFAALAAVADVLLYYRCHPPVKAAPVRPRPAGQNIRVTGMRVIPELPPGQGREADR